MRKYLAALLLPLLLLGGCTKPNGGQTEIHVFIASSLEDAFQDIVDLYEADHPDVRVICSADSSGTLLTQIMEGYRCDIFFSAASAQMDTLEQAELVQEGSRVELLRNEVVLITHKGSNTAVTGLDTLGRANSIALADGSVPAGRYTRAALQALGILDGAADPSSITAEEVSIALGGVEINQCRNASTVKEAVKEGANEVGTVYYSDAWSVREDVDIIQHIPAQLTGDILYPVCRVVNHQADGAQSAAADDFFTFLQSEEAMTVFEAHMFIPNR